MTNQCFFIKLQEALCRIITFDQKSLPAKKNGIPYKKNGNLYKKNGGAYFGICVADFRIRGCAFHRQQVHICTGCFARTLRHVHILFGVFLLCSLAVISCYRPIPVSGAWGWFSCGDRICIPCPGVPKTLNQCTTLRTISNISKSAAGQK